MTKIKSMDLFWQALLDYSIWKESAFFLVDEEWNKHEQDLSWYFRNSLEQFDNIEKTLIKNSAWKKLLDIGSATWYYFKFLKTDTENVQWTDISPNAILAAKNIWVNNIIEFDVMKNILDDKYDIITLMWNNLSIGGSIPWAKKLIWNLKKMLTDNGRILSVFRKEEDQNYFVSEFQCEYQWQRSDYFNWIRININFLEKILFGFDMRLKILSENDYGYCLEIRNLMF